MQASAVIGQVAETLQDESSITWTPAQLVSWLNDAQRAVASLRIDASVNTVNIDLAVGAKQSITGRRLLGDVQNMGADGNTPGRAVSMVSKAALDSFSPNWQAGTEAAEIVEYMYDDRLPNELYVNPPSDGTTELRALQAVDPIDCDNEDSEISVGDIYAPALIEWILYRCFARDSEETPNYIRAEGHFRNFFNILGMKLQGDMRVSAKNPGNKQ